MPAAALSTISLSVAHRQFEAALPAMRRVIRYHLRHWPGHGHQEAIADAVSAAWAAWYGLVRRGLDPTRVGPTGIAYNACRAVRSGRRLGCGTPGRGEPCAQNARPSTGKANPTKRSVSADQSLAVSVLPSAARTSTL